MYIYSYMYIYTHILYRYRYRDRDYISDVFWSKHQNHHPDSVFWERDYPQTEDILLCFKEVSKAFLLQ